MSHTKLTQFANVWDARSEIDLQVEQILQVIRSDGLTEYQDRLRNYLAEDGPTSKRYRDGKRHLPAVTLAGVFREGREDHHLTEYSGIVHLDLDGLNPLQVEEYQKRLTSEEHVFLAFASPSGRGIKVACIHDGGQERHEEVFWAWREHILGVLNCPEEKSDDSVRNLSRLCFLSSDPNAYLNKNPKKFGVKKHRILFDASKHQLQQKHDLGLNSLERSAEQLRFISGFDDYETWVRIGLALKAEHGESAFDLWRDWSAQSSKFSGDSDLLAKWRSFDPSRISGATLTHLARESGWQPEPIKRQNTPKEANQGKIEETPEKIGFRFIEANEFLNDLQPPDFLVSGMLESDSLISLVGEPGSGKSFLALDWACSIAAGRSWMDRRTKTGTVFYLAGEGRYGLKRRLMVWADRHGRIPQGRLHFSNQAIALTEAAYIETTYQAIEEIHQRTKEKPSLIIVDTLARHFGIADENSTQGMSQFVSMLDALRSQWGCTVLIVHHTGKDRSKGARGNSALLGALDASFMVEMDEEKRITLSNQKMKDGETPENQFFALVSQRVEIGRAHV